MRQCPSCGAVFGTDHIFCGICATLLEENGHPPAINGYQVEEKIGEGGMGVVYRGHRISDEKPVAIKFLRSDQGARALARFRREASLHARLRGHPHIAEMLDIIDHPQTPAIVVELLTGCTLKELLQVRKRLSPEEAVWIAEKVLNALSAAHKAGIVHRDIKPSNIFLTDDGNVKLMDFGLAKTGQGDDITATGMAVGAFFYTPPEQILGQVPQPASDLYALGVVLHEMLAGEVPFSAEEGGEFALMEKHLRTAPPALNAIDPSIPASLSRLVLSLLAKDPEKRPSSANEARNMLLGCAKMRPPSLPEGASTFSDLRAHAQIQKTRTEEEVLEPETILWAVRHAPKAPKTPPVDLKNPPPLTRDTLLRLRRAIDNVPPLPEIWQEVQAVLNDPEAAPMDLARVIEKDPALVAHVLALARRAAWSPVQGAITTPSVAIARLGMDRVRDALLAELAHLGGFEHQRLPLVRAVWRHMLAVAHLTRALSEYAPLIDARTAGLLGLLHDLGKLIVLAFEDETRLQSLFSQMKKGVHPLRAEWDVLGYSHIDAGMMLALHWGFPRAIYRLIYTHHHPEFHPASDWPIDGQALIMLLHTAHLLLDAFMQEDEEGFSPLQADPWCHPRRHHPSAEALLRKPLALPLADRAVYQRLRKEAQLIVQAN